MKTNFYRPTHVDTHEFDALLDIIRLEAQQICNGGITSAEDAVEYVSDLISKQKILEKDQRMAFWGFDEPNHMPSDCRVIYFYIPTYYLTAAFLTLVVQYSDLLTQNSALIEPLQKALLGCTGRNFTGHGFESFDGFLTAMNIFAAAPVATFLERCPDLCPEFTALWRESDAELRDKLQSGEAGRIPDEWSGKPIDYTQRISDIVAMIDESNRRFQ